MAGIRSFGYLGVKPAGDLASTAEVLGSALGGLRFTEDTERRYDEFPAYIAEQGDLRYSLLGPPSPEDDLREEKTDDFQLMVKPIASDSAGPKADISRELLTTIERDGRLQCWLLD